MILTPEPLRLSSWTLRRPHRTPGVAERVQVKRCSEPSVNG